MNAVDDIKKLRDVTGAGVMECKKALADSRGDFDAAIKFIHERGLAKMEKRSDREAGAGLIQSYVHNERIGVILDVRAETDFVVRSEPFKKLAHDLAMHVAAAGPGNVEELLKQPYIKDESRTVDEIIKLTSAQVGENIQVKTFSRLEL
ncbi:MAG TPA: translation elongation factor Ts [Candidatus Paceibacterota bacterium]|nr:translation elongation factor Ts [Candidatus Paceibacterota bacterium]